MKNKIILQKEVMSYKQQIKTNELVTKFKIIRDVKVHKLPKSSVADKYSMHRNWVLEIIKLFENNIDPWVQEELLSSRCNFSKVEIEEKLKPITAKSKKPLSNKNSASKEQEKLIVKYHEDHGRMWYMRMYNIIRRKLYPVHWVNIKKIKNLKEFDKNIDTLRWLTFSQMKWIYKRNNLKAKKVRTANWWRVALYDYMAIWAFEFLHYDTKDVLDMKALLDYIYKKFKCQPESLIVHKPECIIVHQF